MTLTRLDLILKKIVAGIFVLFSSLLAIFGWFMPRSSDAVFVFVLSAFFAAVPSIFGAKKIRIAAFVLFITVIVFAAEKQYEVKHEKFHEPFPPVFLWPIP